MSTVARVVIYALMLLASFALVFVATAANSAIPLFFGFVPALVTMWVEREKA